MHDHKYVIGSARSLEKRSRASIFRSGLSGVVEKALSWEAGDPRRSEEIRAAEKLLH